MIQIFIDLFHTLVATVWDVLPIVVILFSFQRLAFRKPMPNRKK
jgi:hypothetical protein